MNASGFKGRLFWTVSGLVLMTAGGWASSAEAADPAYGGMWLELSGQYVLDDTTQSQSFVPLIPNDYNHGAISPGNGYSVAGKLTYQPSGSPYTFALGVRYGSTSTKTRTYSGTSSTDSIFQTTQNVSQSIDTSHTIVDFEVGKDMGIGVIGPGTQTTVGLGLRYAHLSATTNGSFLTATTPKYSTNAGRFHLHRSSDLGGPRAFFKVTVPLSQQNGVSLGFGLGAAILYGHLNINNIVNYNMDEVGESFPDVDRSHSEVVPNMDGFAQLNWAPSGAPLTVSAGYRFDSFWNAIDGGLTNTNNINVFSSGPYLSMVFKFH